MRFGVSEILLDVFINTIILLLDFTWKGLPNRVIHCFDNLRVQIRCDNDVLFPHLLDVGMRLLVVSLSTEEFDELREDISKSDGLLSTWGVNQ